MATYEGWDCTRMLAQYSTNFQRTKFAFAERFLVKIKGCVPWNILPKYAM